jgi:hypothetical protein
MFLSAPVHKTKNLEETFKKLTKAKQEYDNSLELQEFLKEYSKNTTIYIHEILQC